MIKITKKNYKGKTYDLIFNKTDYYFALKKGLNNNDKITNNQTVMVHNCDIDFDSEDGGRDKVLEYLIHKYQQESVCNVVTFGTFGVKSALKDISRGLRKETGMNSILNKKIVELPDIDDVKDIIAYFKELKETTEDTEIAQWIMENNDTIRLSNKVLGQIKSLGTHAGGIVVTPKPIYEYIPVTRGTGNLVTAFSESDGSDKQLSELGILKLDVLGLQILNVLKSCVINIKNDKWIDLFEYINYLPFEDSNMIESFCKGDNYGIFQMEKSKMFIDAFEKGGGKVSSFADIIAINAMNRPGPLEKYINKYGYWKAVDTGIIKVDEGKLREINKDRYPFPFMEDILGSTYGAVLYQEQIMSLVCELTGMSFGESDVFRRSIAWTKDHPKYYTVEPLFTMVKEAMYKKGYSEKDADFFLKYLNDVSGYSFNKCLSKNHKVISKDRGEINILDVKIGEYIKGFNVIKKEDEWVAVKCIHHNGVKSIYHSTTSSGLIIECTADHKILCEDGVMRPLMEVVKKELKIKTKNGYEYILDVQPIFTSVETYDLEIDSEFHNFYANGVCVSNSHSVAYAYIAWQCLYFKTYYPVYFYTALLNHEDKTEKKVQVIIFAKSQGLKVKSIAIHKSSFESTIEDDETIRLGYKLLKGMGDAAREELEMLNLGACNTINEVLEKPFKKVNSTALNNLIDLGCFDELEPNRNIVRFLFSLYKEPKIEKWFSRKKNPLEVSTMPEILKENFDIDFVVDTAMRVSNHPNPHYELIKQITGSLFINDDTPEEIEEKTMMKEKELLGFNLTLEKDFEIFIADVTRKGMVSLSEGIKEAEDENINGVYFKINTVSVALTKTKKPYLRLSITDGAQVYDKVTMWLNGSEMQIEQKINAIQRKVYCIGRFKKNNFGLNLVSIDNL